MNEEKLYFRLQQNLALRKLPRNCLHTWGRSEKDVLPDQTKRNQNTVAIEPLEPNLATENTAVDEKNSTEGIIPPFSEKPKAAAQPKKHHIDLNFFTKSSKCQKGHAYWIFKRKYCNHSDRKQDEIRRKSAEVRGFSTEKCRI